MYVDTCDRERFRVRDLLKSEASGRGPLVVRVAIKNVGEHLPNSGERFWSPVTIQRLPAPKVENAKIVRAANMIGVAVSEDYGINMPHAVFQALVAKIRSGVNKDTISRGQADECRSTVAPVARVLRSAH